MGREKRYLINVHITDQLYIYIYIYKETERTTMNYYKNIIFTFLGMIIITIVYAQVPNPPNSEMSLTDAAELLTKRGYDPYSHPGSVKPLYTEEYESLRRLCMEAAEVCKVSTRQDELSEHRAGQKECVDFGGFLFVSIFFSYCLFYTHTHTRTHIKKTANMYGPN